MEFRMLASVFYRANLTCPFESHACVVKVPGKNQFQIMDWQLLDCSEDADERIVDEFGFTWEELYEFAEKRRILSLNDYVRNRIWDDVLAIGPKVPHDEALPPFSH
jgi:hypothetical protein